MLQAQLAISRFETSSIHITTSFVLLPCLFFAKPMQGLVEDHESFHRR